MRKYSKVLLAGLVASMMVGCQGEEKKETPVPTKDVNVQTTLQPTQEPQNLVEHEYIKDNENNKAVNSNVAYKIKEKQHPEDGSVWTSKVEECDKDGNVLKEIDYVDENIESGHDEMMYNAKGNVLTKKSYNGGKLYRTYSYEYDSYGDLVKETEVKVSSGEEDIVEYKYLYADDCMVKKTRYYNGEKSGYTEYKYDENNRVIKETVYNGYDALMDEYSYEYDDKGNVTTSIHTDGGSNIETSMTYDSNNNLIEKKESKYGEITKWNQYTYNGDNGLVETKELNEDGTVERITKVTRDSKNRQIKEIGNRNGKDYDYWVEWEYVEVK